MITSIVVPCYNEEKNIKELVKRFRAAASKYDIELVLVDNGSEDNTGSEIKKYANRYSFIVPVHIRINQGYGYGILKGLQAASGDILGWMHADLQSDPAVFCKMIRMAEEEKRGFLYKGRRSNRPFIDSFFTLGMSMFETLLLKQVLWDINAQPTLLSRKFYESWEKAPYDFSLDLYVYYLAKIKKIKIRRFKSRQYQRLNGASTWNTGMAARFKLMKRVFSYSKRMKKLVTR